LSRCAAIFLLTLAFAGCRRTSGPDENYHQAAALYQQLYATQLDDAYGDPGMDEVVALLRKVNPRSIDAQPAEALLGTIQRGREALAKERAEREKMAAAATQSAAPMINIDPSRFLPPEEPDGGPPQDPFGAGASVAELNKQSGGCLVDNEPFSEQGTGVGGTVYRVAPSDTCRSRLPGLVGQVVLVVNGKIYRRTADPRPPPPPATDAGPAPAARPAAAPRPAQRADAGEPQYYFTAPGQPQPGATPPPAEQPR
jgi:hypothetical protein